MADVAGVGDNLARPCQGFGQRQRVNLKPLRRHVRASRVRAKYHLPLNLRGPCSGPRFHLGRIAKRMRRIAYHLACDDGYIALVRLAEFQT